MKLVPNLHPAAVIRNRNRWEPLFISALDSALSVVENNEVSEKKNSVAHLQIDNKKYFSVSSYSEFKNLLNKLKENDYKLVDVQRYKDFSGNNIIDQGIFAKFSNNENRIFVLLNDLKSFHYVIDPTKQSPEPILKESQVRYEEGPTVKEILVDRWKALKMYKDKVYYNVDFLLDDWLTFQTKEVIPDNPKYQICFFDIEVYAADGLFPNERDGKYPISAISLVIDNKFYQLVNCDLLKSKLDEQVIHKHIKENNVTIENFNLIQCKNEIELLYKFADLLKSNNVDVLTAWNIYFDINYIANRCNKALNLDTSIFSPVAKKMYPSGKFGFHIIPGIIIADLLALYKNYEKREARYNLDTIAQKILGGLRKVKYEGTLVDLLEQDPNRYVAYSAVDTKLIQLIEKKKQDLSLHLMLKDLSWVSYLNSYSTLAQIDGLIYQYTKQKHYVVRMKPRKTDKSGAFVGAFVREPRKGYIPYVIDLDASSMYPSIMISLNISPETFIGYIELQPPIPDYASLLLTNKYDDCEVSLTLNPNKERFQNSQKIKVKVKDLKEKVYSNDLTISFAGTIFDNRQKGLITYTLDDLIKKRHVYKDQALQLLSSNNTKEKSQGSVYNIIQKALKVLANAIYGAMGNSGFRFFDTRISITITLTGQYEIKFISKSAEEFTQSMINKDIQSYKDFTFNLTPEKAKEAESLQHYVFYSDTDSSFIDIYDLMVQNLPKTNDEFNKLTNNNISDKNLIRLIKEDNDHIHPIVKKMFSKYWGIK